MASWGGPHPVCWATEGGAPSGPRFPQPCSNQGGPDAPRGASRAASCAPEAGTLGGHSALSSPRAACTLGLRAQGLPGPTQTGLPQPKMEKGRGLKCSHREEFSRLLKATPTWLPQPAEPALRDTFSGLATGASRWPGPEPCSPLLCPHVTVPTVAEPAGGRPQTQTGRP